MRDDRWPQAGIMRARLGPPPRTSATLGRPVASAEALEGRLLLHGGHLHDARPAPAAMTADRAVGDAGLPAVLAHSPGGTTPHPIDRIDFFFNQPMDAASFSAADDVLSFTGPSGEDLRPRLTGHAWLDGNRTLRLTANASFAQGTYTATLGPQILAGGQPLDQDGDGVPGEAGQDRYAAQVDYGPCIGVDAFG